MNPPLRLPRRARRGFTLIELLTVISIIAILAAIMVPTVSVALVHVKKAKTVVQLSNLVNVCRMYKSYYKKWPTFTTPPTDNDLAFSLLNNAPQFVNTMMGNPDATGLQWNPQKVQFANFGESDLTTDPQSVTPIDAFKNEDLYLVFNTNLLNPGQLNGSVITGISMTSREGLTITVDQSSTVPIYNDCVGLSPGLGFSNTDAITTWTPTPNGG